MNPPRPPAVTQLPVGYNGLSLEQLRQRARRHVDEAIQLLDPDTKAAYLEAMERAPEVVEQESDPLKFVRASEYNIWTASVKLCRYWKERKYAFGPDQFIKPLNLSGFGAMGREDMLSLQSGATVVLPKTSDGKYVVFCDRRQHIPSLDRKCRLRCLFYLESTADEAAYREGVYTATLVVTKRNESVDKDYINRSVLLMDQVFAVKNKFMFLNKPPKNDRKFYEIQEFLSDYIRTAMNKATASFLNLDVVFEREEGDIYKELERLGLPPEGIPTSVGGKWTYVEWNRSCLQQALKDREAHDLQLRRRAFRRTTSSDMDCTSMMEDSNYETTATAAMPSLTNPDAISTSGATSASTTTRRRRVRIASTGPLSEAERKARKRAANLVHSRRKRERRKKEQEALQTEHDRLQSEQTTLQAENNRLVRLLEQAKSIVAKTPDFATQQRSAKKLKFATEASVARLSSSASSSSSTSQSGGQNSKERAHDTTSPPTRHVSTTKADGSAATDGFAQLAAEALNRPSSEKEELFALLGADLQRQPN